MGLFLDTNSISLQMAGNFSAVFMSKKVKITMLFAKCLKRKNRILVSHSAISSIIH